MKYINALPTIIALLCAANASFGQKNDMERCRSVFDSCIKACGDDSGQPVGELILRAATFFADRRVPYVAHTLEINDSEALVVNLLEMDCTTLVENCIAIAKTIKSGEITFKKFTDSLAALRYRDGKIDGYPSRLHYTTDWIYENRSRLTNISKELGGKAAVDTINFMSTHSSLYRHLKDSPDNVKRILERENSINRRNAEAAANANYVISADKIRECEIFIKDGDIIAFATSVKGLDYSHLGVACRKNGCLNFIHASSKEKFVVLESKTLSEYCIKSPSCAGISVIRIAD